MVPPFWAAKLGFLARMPGLAGLTKRSRAEPQEACGSRCEPRPSWQIALWIRVNETEPPDPEPPCQNAKPRLVHRSQQSGVEWIPSRGHTAWARKPGNPTLASRNSSPIHNFIWNWLNSVPLRTSTILGSEIGPLSQNAKPRLAHRAQQSGASGILEPRPSWPIVLLTWGP